MKRRDIIKLSSVTLLPTVALQSQAQPKAFPIEQFFDAVNKPQTLQLDAQKGQKVEIRQFFAYWCPHCHHLEPSLLAWAKKLPPSIRLVKNPVAFNAQQRPLVNLFYVLDTFEQKEQLHQAVFNSIHGDRSLTQNVYSKDKDLQEWAVKTLKLDATKVKDLWGSFSIQNFVKSSQDYVVNYELDGIPAFVVQGKHLTGPSRVSKGMRNANKDEVYNVLFQSLSQVAAVYDR